MKKRYIVALIVVICCVFVGVAMYIGKQSQLTDVSSGSLVKNADTNLSLRASSTSRDDRPPIDEKVKDTDLIGTWKQKDQEGGPLRVERYSLENGARLYTYFENNLVVATGTWSLQEDGELHIIGQDGEYTLAISFDKQKNEMSILDEGGEIVYVKVQ
jgi:hypothetical protein